MKIQFVNNWRFEKDEMKQFNVLPDISFALVNNKLDHVMLLWGGFVFTLYKGG